MSKDSFTTFSRMQGGRNQNRRQGKPRVEGDEQDMYDEMRSNPDSPRSTGSLSQRNPALPSIHNRPRGQNEDTLHEGEEDYELDPEQKSTQDQKLRVKVISASGIDPGDALGVYVKMRLLEADSTVQALEAYTSTCDVSSQELYWYPRSQSLSSFWPLAHLFCTVQGMRISSSSLRTLATPSLNARSAKTTGSTSAGWLSTSTT